MNLNPSLGSVFNMKNYTRGIFLLSIVYFFKTNASLILGLVPNAPSIWIKEDVEHEAGFLHNHLTLALQKDFPVYRLRQTMMD